MLLGARGRHGFLAIDSTSVQPLNGAGAECTKFATIAHKRMVLGLRGFQPALIFFSSVARESVAADMDGFVGELTVALKTH
jgi:hypothetical protein